MIVIGDNITDKYSFGYAHRLCPEAPVPVLTNLKTEFRSGGAGNVVKNLESLGNSPLFIHNPVENSIKHRFYANDQMICRVDHEQYMKHDVDLHLWDLKGEKYAILSDYNKGVLYQSQKVIADLNRRSIKSLVDPKKALAFYTGAWLVKCNEKEFARYVDNRPFDIEVYNKACMSQCVLNGFSYIIVTLGANGCFIYDHTREKSEHIKSKHRFVRDVTGAGDVFMAVLGHFVERCYDVFEAARLANELAGISVEHVGTYVLTKDDIDSVVKPNIVFTNGCFDILHPGHIQLLNESKKLGAKLIVGLNSNASVKRLKGANRPILHHDRRKKMLEALGIVDEVIIFEEDTPLELIKQIKPDIITKGGDYKPDEVVGSGLAKVVIIPTLQGYSTTGVINEVIRKS